MKKRDHKLEGLKPGGWRWQAVVQRHGGRVPNALQFVRIDLVCDRHPDRVMGQFGRYTYPGADPRMWMEPLPGGFLPEEAGDYRKVLLVCQEPGCRFHRQIKPDRVEAALDDVFEAGAVERVVTYTVESFCYCY